MKPGPKQQLPSVKALKGTLRNDRDGDRLEIITPDSLPVEPDFLTPGGRLVWLDNIGRIAQTRQATELDSEVVAHWCNLSAAIRDAWASGAVPPSAHLAEMRKIAEQLGLFGAKSRVGTKGAEEKKANPFGKLING